MSETSLAELAVYSPHPRVQVDAQDFPMLQELLLSMEVTEREGGLSALELRVRNVASDPEGGAALAFENDSILRLGARILVGSGDQRAPREIFQGTITGLEVEFSPDGPPAVVVLAEDAFQLARMARRTRIHEDVTLSGLVSDLASQLGLTPVVTGLTENIGTQVQLNESDLAFVRRLLGRHDADLQVVETELHASPRGEVERGAVSLRVDGQLRRARVTADLAHQVTEVTVSGWNASQGQTVTARSTGARLGPGSGRRGGEVLEEAIGARSHHIAHLAVSTDDEAQAVADAAFDGRARRFLVVEGTAEGNPALRVGTHLTLAGLGGRFDNTYYVVLARHRYDRSRGYETDFTAECAYLGRGS